MNAAYADPTARLRWGVYAILISLAVGNMTGRLMSVNSVNRAELESYLIQREVQQVEKKLRDEGLTPEDFERRLAEARARIEVEQRRQRPLLSANDRSRWLAIRALAELGTYEIDSLLDRNVWNTIDMVQHRGRDGQLHLYSSKPPLLITLLAGEYWLIHQLTGLTLADDPYAVDRIMLLTINVLPLGLMFVLIARLAERLGRTDWGRIFVVAAATLGTFLNTFAVVLNNHTVAAVSTAVALWAVVRIWLDGDSRRRCYALAGLATAFAAANELPALALLVGVGVLLERVDYRRTLQCFAPAAALVVLAFFATNYAAHGTLTPPYMHKASDDPDENWYHYTYTVDGVERQSYWMNRQGIDRGEPSRLAYAWHTLLGHHGIFSLTPVWLLALGGAIAWFKSDDRRLRVLALGVVTLSLACWVFYVGLRPQEDRNYGGLTSGLRWMFWFAPLWLVAMLPAADWAAKRRRRQALALLLLAASVFSASYPTWNPWTQPWLIQWMEYCGWQGF